MTGYQKALEAVGDQVRMAAVVGVTKQAAGQWLRRGVPASRVIPVCRAAGWAVTPHELRPDLYPDPDWLPDEARASA